MGIMVLLWSFSFGLIVLLSAPPVSAQESFDPSQYVPRAEHEELKRRLAEVLKRLDALEKSQSRQAAKQTPVPALNAKAGSPDKAASTEHPPASAKPSTPPAVEKATVPGYEIARMRRLAQPNQPPVMNMRIAQAGGIDLFMGFDSVGRMQYLTQDNVSMDGKKPAGLQAGFQTPFANISFMATYKDLYDVYFDFFMASRSHRDYMQGGQGYLLFKKLPQSLDGNQPLKWLFDHVDIKAGGFEIDYGDAHYRRSYNGQVGQNPLIGNYVVDPRAIDIGLEVIGDTGPVKWLAGVGSGTYEGHFYDGSGYSTHAKLWGDPLPGLRSSLSIYHADHSGDGPGWPENNGTAGNLFVTNRSGGSYAGVFGNGDAPGQLMPGAGQLVTAAQLDLTWRSTPLELYGYFGWMQDADTNGDSPGSPKDAWLYYAAEGIYNFTERLYVAGRYSGAAASQIKDASSSGLIHRFALGGGYWLFDTVLFKLEFVYQGLNGFSENDGKVCAVDAWRDPSFYGVITEASFGF